MAAIVDIWNQALSEVGAQAMVLTTTENSKEAQVCGIHYNNLRTSLLRSAPWSCARFQATLALVESYLDNPPTNQFPWNFGYTYPADCLNMRYLLNPPVVDGVVTLTGQNSVMWAPCRANRFLPALNTAGTSKVVLTNVENAIGVYTKDLVDPNLFDQGFWDALVSALCAKICIPLTGNVQMKSTFENLAREAIANARAADGNEAMPTTDHTPDWIRVRGEGLAVPGYLPGIWYSGYDGQAWGM